jgi:tRNA G18 (ribose-2'-O)-methylase SpoU
VNLPCRSFEVRVVAIADPDDERVADYRHLTDAGWRRQLEAEHGLFVAEGRLVIRQVLRHRLRVRSILLARNRQESLAGDLAGIDVPVYVAEPAVLEAVAGFHAHRGVLAAVERPALRPPEDVVASARLVAVLEDVNDHENLGAVFRNAAGLGVGAVLLSPGCCDPLYRRAVRVSMGHVLSVPWTRLEPWPAGLEWLRRRGFALLALTPDPSAEPLAAAPPALRLAVLLGAEGPGLSPGALAAADRRLRIPLAGGVDSLNLASAAAIAFHWLRGQEER